MSDPGKAVFLSYASQDAEAARRICAALRAADIEVWFDQSELRGGDAWDQKIRKQIRECTLFVPVISANTNARPEGYFRLEWKLAVDRSHLMADDEPFIFPVVIDDTAEPTARVPDKFREVQWTRLSVKDTPESLAKRIARLLGGETERPGEVRGSREPGAPRQARGLEPAETAGSRRKRFSPVWLVVLIPAGVTLLLLGLLTVKRYRDSLGVRAGPANPASLAPDPEFPRDPELRRAQGMLMDTDSTPEDYALAENLAKAELAERPNDAEAIIVFAFIQNWTYSRFFDTSDERLAVARRYSEWGAQLAPDHPAALATLGHYLTLRSIDPPRARQLLERAVALAPQNPLYHRALVRAVFATDRAAGLELGRQVVQRFPRDALTRYDLALLYRDAGQLERWEETLDEAIALAPIANALMWKARTRLWLHGDVSGVKAMLDRLPERARLSSRVVATRFLYAMMGGDRAAALQAQQALRALSSQTMEDFYGTAKGLPLGELLLKAGETAQARLQFEGAAVVLRDAAAKEPSNVGYRNAKAWVNFRLGQVDEARQEAAAVLTLFRRPFRAGLGGDWWFSPLPLQLLLGERPTALQLIREAAEEKYSRAIVVNALKLDPRMQPFRDDPEIQALLREPAAQGAGGPETPSSRASREPTDLAPSSAVALAKVEAKSVAVLAFANLSDDKENEYFSDGISEELLNVLAKVPGLKVSARTSAFSFKGKGVAITEIARQLGVAYVVEGSVRKAGSQVRITAQLIKAVDGFHVWSETFTRELKDIFAVQDEIAGLIAKNLELRMGMSAPRPAIDLGAYQEYLLGRAAFAKASVVGMREAVAHFERAVAVEPKFTAAWAQLANAHTRLGRWGGTPTAQAWPAARAAIARAEALEPDSPEVLLVLGWVRRTADWDWRGAEQAFRRTLQLQPNQPDALTGAAILLFNIGRTEEAFRLAQQAAQLDPLNPATQHDLSLMFYFNQNWIESERAARRALQLAPGGSYRHGTLSWSLSKQRRYAEAEAEARRESDDVEQANALSILALARGQEAAIPESRSRTEAVARKLGDDVANLQITFAYLAAALGETDRAFAALERARTSRDPAMAWLRNDHSLAPLYSDPRWNALLHQMGLADEQLK